MSIIYQCRLEAEIMKLKKGVNINDLFETARKCGGDVFLQTKEGDILNLKSLLSRYAVMSIMGNRHLLESAQVVCVQEEDYKNLTEFLEEADVE